MWLYYKDNTVSYHHMLHTQQNNRADLDFWKEGRTRFVNTVDVGGMHSQSVWSTHACEVAMPMLGMGIWGILPENF